MTKAAALQQFFESFGIPAYPTSKVPEETKFPWLTYEPIIGTYYGQNIVSPSIELWYYSDSEKQINAKADEISKTIENGFEITCDDGLIMVYLDSPWNPLNDEADKTIKRRQATLRVIYYTF